MRTTLAAIALVVLLGGCRSERADKLGVELAEVAFRGDTAAASHLLARGADPNSTAAGVTPLFAAVAKHHVEVVRLLLAHGAKPDAGPRDQMPCLQVAAMDGQAEIAAQLADAGAWLDRQDDSGATALDLALLKRHDGVAKLLLSRGARWSDLHEAAYFGDAARLKASLGRKQPVDAADRIGFTALGWACRQGQVEAARLLLDAGASTNPPTTTMTAATPLHQAVLGDSLAAVQLLLDRGARLDAVDGDGYTPLHCAASGDRLAIARLLVERGAALSARSNQGRTPLHSASRRGGTRLIRFLLSRGASVDARDNQMVTPLYLTAAAGSAEAVQALLAAGARPDLANSHGATPLWAAANAKHMDCVRGLLAAGASPNTKGYGGDTPLHLAVRSKLPEMVRLLLDHGADRSQRNDAGRTALDEARRRDLPAVADLLLQDRRGSQLRR